LDSDQKGRKGKERDGSPARCTPAMAVLVIDDDVVPGVCDGEEGEDGVHQRMAN
jgi:hypothetical protein